MECLDATINWMHGWGNQPRLFLLVDHIPPRDSLRYEFQQVKGKPRGYGFYFAETEGYVSFYYYGGPDEGFGGRTFNLVLVDGSEVALKGPWSSNPSAMNRRGFTASVDVTLTDDARVWKRGHTFFGSNVTALFAQEALREKCPYAELMAVSADVPSDETSAAQSLVIVHGALLTDGAVNWVLRPVGEVDKPSPPPKEDPRWAHSGYMGLWPTGMRGSERALVEGD